MEGDYTGKIGIGETKSEIGVSNLEGRCLDCNGKYGHHGDCPTLKASGKVYSDDIVISTLKTLDSIFGVN